MKKIICLLLCLILVFCFNTAAFADVSVDYDLISVPNDQSEVVSVIVNYQGERGDFWLSGQVSTQIKLII